MLPIVRNHFGVKIAIPILSWDMFSARFCLHYLLFCLINRKVPCLSPKIDQIIYKVNISLWNLKNT